MRLSILSAIALLLAHTASAQTLNITVGSTTYQFPATQTGDMKYSNGTTLTVMGKTFQLSDISSMTVDESEVTDNTVSVVYSGTTARVTVAGNVAQYVTSTVSGAHVNLVQSSAVSDATCGEITYSLSGSTTDGEFYLSGSYKATVELSGVTLTNASGTYSSAAVNIQNGKRINIKIAEGTTNTLADYAQGTDKGSLVVKGHAEFKQRGTLNVTARGVNAHGIKTGEYMTVKNSTINILAATKDGIHCNEYFLQESGAVTIGGVGDDGIQVELDGSVSTGETAQHDGEDSGNAYIAGGTLTVNAAAKGVKSAGDLTISSGYVYACSTEKDGIAADGNCFVKGGVVYAVAGTDDHVGLDAGTASQKQVAITGGTVVAIGGVAEGAAVSLQSLSAASWTPSTWYALYSDGSSVLAFKTPSAGASSMAVYTAGSPSLRAGVTVSGGSSYWNGVGTVGATLSGGE